jgi:hypothetical protein
MKNTPFDDLKKMLRATGISEEEANKIIDLLINEIQDLSFREIIKNVQNEKVQKLLEKYKQQKDWKTILEEVKTIVGEEKINAIIRNTSLSVFNNHLNSFYQACKPDQKQEIDKLIGKYS